MKFEPMGSFIWQFVASVIDLLDPYWNVFFICNFSIKRVIFRTFCVFFIQIPRSSFYFIGRMASRQYKQEPLVDASSKRINYTVPPGKDPLNVRILLDMSKRSGYSIDYMKIVKIFDTYRHEPVVMDGWRGFAVSTAQFVRALAIGEVQTIRKRTAFSQTEESFFETQWSGGSPVHHGDLGHLAFQRNSPDLFSDASSL